MAEFWGFKGKAGESRWRKTTGPKGKAKGSQLQYRNSGKSRKRYYRSWKAAIFCFL